MDFINRHLAKSNNSLHIQNTNHHDDNKSPAPEHIPYDYQGRDDLIEKHNYQNDQISHTERSQYSLMHNGNGYNEQMLPDHHGQDNNYDDHLQEHFQNLQINPQVRQRERDEEMQSSARSRQTMFSNASKRRSNGNYKLGSILFQMNCTSIF